MKKVKRNPGAGTPGPVNSKQHDRYAPLVSQKAPSGPARIMAVLPNGESVTVCIAFPHDDRRVRTLLFECETTRFINDAGPPCLTSITMVLPSDAESAGADTVAVYLRNLAQMQGIELRVLPTENTAQVEADSWRHTQQLLAEMPAGHA